MIFIDADIKNDPIKRWELPDKLFFSNGACHILAYAFLVRYPNENFKSIWIRPKSEFKGNHIFVTNNSLVFDYNGFNNPDVFFTELKSGMTKHYTNWSFDLIELSKDVLISEKKSKNHEGLWLRPPEKFLHNALPRAEEYLEKFRFPTF